MTSTWRHSNGGPPKSPFRPQTQNDNDKTFQLNFADSEANKTFIPSKFLHFRYIPRIGEGLFEQESCEETIHSLTLFVGGGTIGDKIGLK